MATYNVIKAKHQTLVASTVDTVNLSGGFNYVEVSNWGSARIFFTIDGSTPTVGGDDSYPVGPGGSLPVPVTTPATVAVKLISAGANDYSVVGF
jgi:hypothetical protein